MACGRLLDTEGSPKNPGRPLLERCGNYLLARVALILALATLATLLTFRAAAPPERSLEDLAAMLGRAVGGEVDPGALVWEPSRGGLLDPVLGRRVLFLASIDGGPRDLYRATVRVSREGRPITVRQLRNLTNTPLGDESDLVARGRRVAFTTRAFDVVQGVTVLRLQSQSPAGSWWQRVLAGADNWLREGSVSALERTDLVFEPAPTEIEIELRDRLLVMALGDPPHPAALDLDSASLNLGGRSLSAELWTTTTHTRSSRQLLTSVLRGALGRATADRMAARLAFVKRVPAGGADGDAQDQSAPPDGADAGSWPPAAITLPEARPGEGVWREPSVALARLTGVVGDPDPALVETTIRPDGRATLLLVAMDMRQLELRIVAGQRVPRSLSGPAASGRIAAAEPAVAVAAFNGALDGDPEGAETEPDGLVVARRVLVPPRPGAATVVVELHGRGELGSWSGDDAVPASVAALRQSLDPLIEDGRVNPRGRQGWGLPGGAELSLQRTALCRTHAGHLVYGWSEAIAADTLARGMLQAGCQDALHLAMSPTPTGFFYLGDDQDPATASPLAEPMDLDPSQLFAGSERDFFYLVPRQIAPSTGAISWQADGGAQPPPAWLPAVHRARSEKLGAEVALWAIDVERFRWQIRPGNRERSGQTSAGPLDTPELARAMIAVSLGVGFRRDNRRGLVLDGMVSLPIHGDRGVLATEVDGSLSLSRSLDDMAPRGDASELLLLAAGGTLRSEAKRLGARALRGAACMLDGGTMLLAEANYDSSQPIAMALLELGCERIVSLNRGRQVRAFVHRAGTEPPPQAEYDDTVLYGMSKPAPGRLRAMTR